MRKIIGALAGELKTGTTKEMFLSRHDVECFMIFTPEQEGQPATFELFPVEPDTVCEVVLYGDGHVLLVEEEIQENNDLLPSEILQQYEEQQMMQQLKNLFAALN